MTNSDSNYVYSGIGQMLEALPNLALCNDHVYIVKPNSHSIQELCYIGWRDVADIKLPAFAIGVLTSYAPAMLRLLYRLNQDLGIDLGSYEYELSTLIKDIDADLKTQYERAEQIAKGEESF